MDIDELIDMDWKGQLGMAFTVAVATIVIVGLLTAGIPALLNPTIENISDLIVLMALNWWVPLVKEHPLLFVGMLFLFSLAGEAELLEW